MLVKIYAGEIAKTRVRANLLDPGIVRTRLAPAPFPAKTRAACLRRTASPTPSSPLHTRNGEVVVPSAVSSRPNE
jgi:hypothetical protein